MGQQDRFNREYYPALSSSWETRGGLPEDNQYVDQHVSERKGAPPPMLQILREHARIPAQSYFMAAVLDDGSVMTFVKPGSIPSEKVRDFFDEGKFRSNFSSTATSVSTPAFDEHSIPYRRPPQDMDSHDDFGTLRLPRNMKRRADFGVEQTQSHPISRKKKTKALVISETKQLWLFYEQRFKNCQQAACKLIAKAWIKTVEPKKQSTHPYTGKDEKAPDWWPQPWGNGQENKVRHKEPDHLYKKERLRLLGHILRMIIEPRDLQHPDIRKLQLDVTKLEEVTWEALSAWFADNNNPGNIQKKLYLEEIFKVAKQEERFRDGRIDATTKVHVMSDDRIEDAYASDTEENSPSRLDGTQDHAPISRSITPHKGLTQHMATYTESHGPMDNANGSMQGSYMSDAVLRGSHYSNAVAGPDFPEEVARYGEISGMPTGPQLHSAGSMGLSEMHYMQAHDPSRRSSVADPHTEYVTPTTPSSYGPWANTAAPSNTTMYSMPGPSYQSTTMVPVGQPNVPMTQAPPYPIIYDAMPRSHDLGPTNMLRGTMAHGSIPGPSGYQDYGHPGARVLNGSGIKQEGLNRTISHLH